MVILWVIPFHMLCSHWKSFPVFDPWIGYEGLLTGPVRAPGKEPLVPVGPIGPPRKDPLIPVSSASQAPQTIYIPIEGCISPIYGTDGVENMNMLIKTVILNNCHVRKLNTFCRMHRLDPDNEEESLVPTLSTFMDIQLALRWSATDIPHPEAFPPPRLQVGPSIWIWNLRHGGDPLAARSGNKEG